MSLKYIVSTISTSIQTGLAVLGFFLEDRCQAHRIDDTQQVPSEIHLKTASCLPCFGTAENAFHIPDTRLKSI
jgi:hypothetical protein